MTDPHYIREVQYRSDSNLAARQSLYRFQQPRVAIQSFAFDLAELRGDEVVLDAGCGNGSYLAELQRREHQGLVTCLDMSPGMLAAASAQRPDALVVGDAQRLPFVDASFDVVLAMHMLYHVPDRARAIADFRRVLRPDGVFLALTNADGHIDELNRIIAAAVEDATGEYRFDQTRSFLVFSAESGGDELAQSFTRVERHDADSFLMIGEVQPVVDYAASMHVIVDLPAIDADAALRGVARRVASIVDRDGVFRVSTRVACFVCRD
jgi:ubiquinone/menaquinone biosynthesis C-methylase UbiE